MTEIAHVRLRRETVAIIIEQFTKHRRNTKFEKI